MNRAVRVLVLGLCLSAGLGLRPVLAAPVQLTVKDCMGTMGLSTEERVSRITFQKPKPMTGPDGACSLEGPPLDLAANPVLDFWIRVRGDHTVAINVSLGRSGAGYAGRVGWQDYAINLVGTQTGTLSLGDLEKVNSGEWRHIIFDLGYAIESRLHVQPQTFDKVSLSIMDGMDALAMWAGIPQQPLATTVELRDVVVRQTLPDESYANDLILSAAVSPAGTSGDGQSRHLVGGYVVSRRALPGLKFSIEGAKGTLASEDWGTLDGRKDFALVVAAPPEDSEVAVKLVSADGSTAAEMKLRLLPQLDYMRNANVNIIPNSHNDIGWLDTPEATGNWRRDKVIGPALPLLKANPNYRFGMETNLFLMEYLNRVPAQADTIRQLITEGRLTFGATYNQPYPSLWRGESLIRQLYYGRKWLRENLGPEVDSVTVWGTDVPSVAMQMPQILAKSGVKHLMLGRFRPGIFNWYSPDGSKVTVGSLGVYGAVGTYLKPYDPLEVALQLPPLLRNWESFYQQHRIPAELPITEMGDYVSPSKELFRLGEDWNSSVRDKYGVPVNLKFATGEEFMQAVTRDSQTRFPEVRGEWPSVWAYIHGPTHHDTVSAGRDAVWALTSAEKFWTLRMLVPGERQRYPKATFDQAWMAQIYPDHGFGGRNGDITDAVFLAKENEALLLGKTLLNSSVDWIAQHTRPLDSQHLKLVLLNPLSWKRSGPAWVEIPTPPNQDAVVVDAAGKTIPIQRTPQAAGGRTRYLLEARNIPSVGYSTLAVRFQPQAPRAIPQEEFKSKVIENEFYRLEFAPGGLKSIYDKQLKKELLNPEQFLGGEIYMLDSEGNGAHEFGDFQHASWTHIEKASQYSPSWKLIEKGVVRTGWRMEQPFRQATIRLDVYAYAGFKRLDFDVQILHWSGEKNREFRMALPAAIPQGRVAYEVPYGVLEVGKDEIEGMPFEGWYSRPAREIHPREVQDWIAASGGDMTVMLSSSVAVWDYLDAKETQDRFTLLQPILLAARKSCHPQGNWYLQQGDHSYHFSLTSFAGDWRRNPGFGNEVNSPFPSAVVAPEATTPAMPSTMSLCESSQAGFIVSEIKMADDSNGLIVRGYETAGREVDVTLEFPLQVERANATSLIEENLPQPLETSGGRLQFKAGSRSINAFRVVGKWDTAERTAP